MIAVATSDPLLDWLVNNASVIGVLSFVLMALIRGWLVTGREHDRVLLERDRALEIVYTQAEATNRALAVAEKVRSLRDTKK